MDTDSLSKMSYKIITKAYGVCDYLATQIGASCSGYESEEMFLNETANEIDELIDDPESHLEFSNLPDTVDIEEFRSKLIDLRKYIKGVIDTPLSKRGESFV